VDAIFVPEPTAKAIEAFRRSAGGWKDLLPGEFISGGPQAAGNSA